MQFSQEKNIPTILYPQAIVNPVQQNLQQSFLKILMTGPNSQNIKYNSFFGKLLLLMEYIVQEFTQKNQLK